MLRGADPLALEEKIKKHYQDGEDDGGEEVLVKGHVSVVYWSIPEINL